MNKFFYSLILFLAVLNCSAQFVLTPTNWPTPQGGTITGGTQLGYNWESGSAVTGQSNNSQSWTLVDMNGDGKVDLLVTDAWNGTNSAQFNATTSPNWQVFLNTGSGFSGSATSWSTPQGGVISGGTHLGYAGTTGIAIVGESTGSQSWALVDMNGDGKPDLVVTAALGANGAAQFNAGTSPNWQVYMNTGTGFSATATTWSTPKGGTINNSDTLGFGYTSWVTQGTESAGSESWDLVDINGDGKPDLVVTAALNTSLATQFGAGATPTWKVYLNTGSGFSSTATTWSTPQGGVLNNTTALGYNFSSMSSSLLQTDSSQAWSLVDIDGDHKPDLVVTSVMVTGGAVEFNGTSAAQAHWKVYHNTGSGFSGTATNWLTGQGGLVTGTTTMGFLDINGVAGPGQGVNSQTWSLVDINGDGKPDLIVEASYGIQGATEWSPTADAYWELFSNTGTGFSSLVKLWKTPIGGEYTNQYLGFNGPTGVAAAPQGNNSKSWSLTDMYGDGYPDLVVQGAMTNNANTEFSPTSSPYWEVYKNSLQPAGVGIADEKTTFPCLLYPNPNTGSFNLEFSDDITREVEVTDITGNQIITGRQVTKHALITLPALAQGIYFVTIRENGLAKVMKVSVTR